MAENSLAEPARRGPGRPFPPGVSGNPGGRPREVRAIEGAIREAHTTPRVLAVLEKLEALALAGDVQAAKVYLDRVVGPVRVDNEAIIEREVIRRFEEALAAARARFEQQQAANGGLPPNP